MLIKKTTINYKSRWLSHRGSTTTKSSGQTQKLGETLAKKILKLPTGKGAVVFGLSGNLGGGKTTFLQGVAKGLKIKEKILSPTFVIMKRFHIPDSTFHNFYHIDCYRLKDEKDILELDFKSIISNPKNIVAIEWPERIYPVEFAEGNVLQKAKRFNRGKKTLSPPTFIIRFKFIDRDKREIIIKNC